MAICRLPAPGFVPAALQVLQEEGSSEVGDKLCWCFHVLLAVKQLMGRFSRKALLASVCLSSCPTPTTSQTHQASVLARDCKHVWKPGWGHLTQKASPSSSFPVNKASVHMITPSDIPFSRCCSCFVKLFATIHFSL